MRRSVLAAAALAGLLGLVLAAQGLWMPLKAALAQVLLERAFARLLAGEGDVKPWPWADFQPAARLSAPGLGDRAVVLRGASGQALAFGPGHLAGTPEPGEPGLAVYAGHRDTHFAFIGALRPGDELVVERPGGTFRFRTTATEVVRWDAPGLSAQEPGRGLVLASCWPLDSMVPGPWRYLVRAELVEAARAGL